ncbi:MAG TPA: DUF1330 domain-containing protein [Solirubrobacteraceae bacterium]|nr:DUF1330 domain-containing protein [Solirubrobacteraceae bacterium]
MPAYVIANVTKAWDQDKLVEYREGNTDAVAKHGGRFVARGGRHEILEGDYAPLRVVIIKFPDLEAARGWYESDDYAPLRELRRSASETDIYVVEGA